MITSDMTQQAISILAHEPREGALPRCGMQLHESFPHSTLPQA